MKVYDYKAFPNPMRVRIALAEKDLLDKVEFVHVDVPGGAHKTPEFLAKNPFGAVPVLELEDGTLLSECTAITEYADLAVGEPVLTGKGARERGLIHMRQRKIEAGFLDALATCFHHATEGLGPEIETYQNKAWGEHQKGIAVKTMDWMEGLLAKQDYLAGDRFTVADITALAGFGFADLLGVKIPDTHKHLRAWRERASARPSVVTALQ